jgi:hypothetical protein
MAMAFCRCGWKLRIALAIVLIVLVYGVVNVFWHGPGAHVTISKETTYITEPLRKDGWPDYVAALNQQASKGVTPENNAAVLFWKAMGPAAIGSNCREKYFQMLGIPPLPEKGDYFVASDAHIDAQIARRESQKHPTGDVPDEKLRGRLWQQFDSTMKRPWSRQEFPVWNEWLTANEKPLTILVEASRRPRRHDPVIGEMVIAIPLPGPQASRDVARALVARSMLRAHEGNADEAWQDLLACHRLARLVGQGPTLVEALVAVTINGMACAGDQALLEHGKLTPAQIAVMREDLAKLPPMPKMADKLDVTERFEFLDAVGAMARQGPESLNDPTTGYGYRNRSKAESLLEAFSMRAVDWDIILRMGNSWYDRLVEASRKPTHAERKKALRKINADLEELAKSARGLKSLLFFLLWNRREAVSERMGQIVVALFLPALSGAVEAEDRSTMQIELTDLAFALAAYRADHGSYPTELADLTPKYVATVPKDIFNNDTDLHYKREGGGYLLYSVGSNGKDDGGKGYDDRKNGEDWDDLVVHMPAAAKR